mmetsp:Transcript_2762/g.7158  ORF Transcript_2762/g.7158 Transcript_2762/m.7158 type:complete len:252 (+) Transcript_2762:620-1375(+)
MPLKKLSTPSFTGTNTARTPRNEVFQKSASRLNLFTSPCKLLNTPLFWYSPTRFSKKLVLPCRLMISIQSKGLAVFQCFSQPRATKSLSATNSMYCIISFPFMPIRSTGSASEMNSCSMVTASTTISRTRSADTRLFIRLCRRQAKSQCRPSSREMSSLEKVRPGMRPRFFSQKMAQKEPEKKMPSTQAKAIKRSSKCCELSIHFRAQWAFFLTQGTVSIAWNSLSFSTGSRMYCSSINEYISLWMFSIAI